MDGTYDIGVDVYSQQFTANATVRGSVGGQLVFEDTQPVTGTQLWTVASVTYTNGVAAFMSVDTTEDAFTCSQ